MPWMVIAGERAITISLKPENIPDRAGVGVVDETAWYQVSEENCLCFKEASAELRYLEAMSIPSVFGSGVGPTAANQRQYLIL